ncbi:MAG: histidine phosphatase family protein [Planctomycetales bacterium]|nr:histidine phosphatase family protein [Planctomycetales bacterium]MCA9167002.1 histidine phosphatase family protein [Planctomycetales bacterium]
MTRVVLVRPGTTDFDEQRRITGTLDIPLNAFGLDQITRTANELTQEGIELVYCAPCQAAEESARVLSQTLNVKTKTLPALVNLDHGLWQGKLVDEVKATQRKVFRQWQEQPETVCPPEGEMLDEARERVDGALEKLLKKHRNGVFALVVPEPLATVVGCQLTSGAVGDLWQGDCKCGSWQMIDVDPSRSVDISAAGH